MEYFNYFPKMEWNGKQVTDITIRLDFIKRIKDNIALFQYYILKDNQRPEDIANEIYGDPTLYWIVLYLNNIIDPFYDWILNDDNLKQYIVNKYGEENIYATHHYETTAGHELGKGIQVNFGTPFSAPVTNYDYEHEINESKRKIKILKARYIPQILVEYQRELDQQ